MKTTYTYGVLPPKEDIVAACGPTLYPMELVGQDARIAQEVLRMGADRMRWEIYTPVEYPHKLGLRLSPYTVPKFLACLIELYESGKYSDSEHDAAGDLASCILETLGFEWV